MLGGGGGGGAIKCYYFGCNKNFYIMDSYVKTKSKKNSSKRFFLFTSSKGLHVLKKREMEKERWGGWIFPQIQVFMDLQANHFPLAGHLEPM
jgi:hypothetical protein